MPKDILIVGSGFGGLSAAALLANEGFNVTVLEKNSSPGGRARVWSESGFKFDLGPSWYLMPDVFERFFAEFEKKPSDFYELIRLDPAYRLIFGKDDVVDISPRLEDNLELFNFLEDRGADKMINYLKTAKYQYDVSMDGILYEDLTSVFDFLKPRLLMRGMRLNVFGNLEKKVNKIFSSDKLKKILLYSVVFLGGDPKNTPAIYSLMSHVDFNLGVWYPKGGIGSLVEGMITLGKSLGVTYIYDQEVTSVQVENGIAKGVTTATAQFQADAVVINTDYHHAETQLLSPEYQRYPEKYWEKKTIAPSAYLIYLGLDIKLPGLDHHTLVLDNDWQRHFRQIFDDPQWPQYPSYYVCSPSKTDDTVAPEGHENLFILVPVAAGLDDTDANREMYFEKMISHFEDLMGQNIRNHIVVKRIFTQRDFVADYNAYKGTALGLSHTLMQSVMFRPHHKSKKVSNLYFTGQYTHPGIGVPMVLISSTIVRDLIRKDFL
jgi:phytoene desaturase